MNSIICGVDVSKEWLDVFIRPLGISQRFSNDAADIGALYMIAIGRNMAARAFPAKTESPSML